PAIPTEASSPGEARGSARGAECEKPVEDPRGPVGLGEGDHRSHVVCVREHHHLQGTWFRRAPIPSLSTSTPSPGALVICGSWKKQTPCGVPVRIRSPGSRVMSSEA